jgi:HD-like signal output (HDOD) protein
VGAEAVVSAPALERRSGLLAALLLELEQRPPAQAAALRVVQAVDDPASGSADVARAAASDPGLTTRMLRMANSAYYGLSGRVCSASFAVTVIGFATVRSLAAVSAAGFVGDGDLPPGFWARGTATAAGTALVARRVGADPAEGFCVGILHDLGTALLHRHDPEVHGGLMARATLEEPVHRFEQEQYGGTHASLCADVLSSWHFPEELCGAIGRHHEPPSVAAAPLRRALQGGIALACLADGSAGPSDLGVGAALEAALVPSRDRGPLVAQVRREADELLSALTA